MQQKLSVIFLQRHKSASRKTCLAVNMFLKLKESK